MRLRTSDSMDGRSAATTQKVNPMSWDTIARLRDAIERGDVPAQFTADIVNGALSVRWTAAFLSKHSAGNRGGYLELFVRVRPGLYQLK